MNESTERVSSTPAEVPAWQGWLAAFVGVIVACNLVLFGWVGRSRIFAEPSERLGYAMGTGLGLGLGMGLVLYLLILRRAARKWTALAFVATAVAGTLATYFVGAR